MTSYFNIIFDNYPLWLIGISYTCLLTFLSCLFGTFLAIILALALRGRDKFFQIASQLFIEIFKSIPLLVLLVWIYYVLPVWSNGWSPNAYWSAVLAFSLNLGAFLAEVLRGGIDAIPKGHIEAAEAVGINRINIIRRIILPETIRRTFASVVVLYIGVLKLSTLASAIGVQELLFNARIINIQTARPMEVYSALALAFVVLVVPLSWGSRIIEKQKWLTLNPTSNPL